MRHLQRDVLCQTRQREWSLCHKRRRMSAVAPPHTQARCHHAPSFHAPSTSVTDESPRAILATSWYPPACMSQYTECTVPSGARTEYTPSPTEPPASKISAHDKPGLPTVPHFPAATANAGKNPHNANTPRATETVALAQCRIVRIRRRLRAATLSRASKDAGRKGGALLGTNVEKVYTSDSLQTAAQGGHSALHSMHSCAADCTSSWQKVLLTERRGRPIITFGRDSWEMTTIIKRRCASI